MADCRDWQTPTMRTGSVAPRSRRHQHGRGRPSVSAPRARPMTADQEEGCMGGQGMTTAIMGLWEALAAPLWVSRGRTSRCGQKEGLWDGVSSAYMHVCMNVRMYECLRRWGWLSCRPVWYSSTRPSSQERSNDVDLVRHLTVQYRPRPRRWPRELAIPPCTDSPCTFLCSMCVCMYVCV